MMLTRWSEMRSALRRPHLRASSALLEIGSEIQNLERGMPTTRGALFVCDSTLLRTYRSPVIVERNLDYYLHTQKLASTKFLFLPP